MQRSTLRIKIKTALALAIAAILASGPALAEKPSWAGNGKSDRDERSEQRDSGKGERREAAEHGKRMHESDRRDHFEERHRLLVRDFYGEQARNGRCPPGLAKKHNGCMPPGQARKWQIGQTLPRDVIYYQVPQQLVTQFGQPPSGYRYVRVASDILLMAVGTGMVVDAIRDLGRS